MGEIGLKGFFHVFEAFQPTLVTDFATLGAVSPTTGDVEFVVPGRLGAALLGPEGLDKRGNVRQLEEELLRYFTGIGEQKVKPGVVIPLSHIRA